MFNINFARDSAPATDDDIQAALKWVTSAIHSEHGATKEIALLLSKLVLRIDESKAEILALKSDLTNCMNAASAEAELADEFKAELDVLKASHQGAQCKIVEANRELLLKRANKGLQTYGVTLEQANLPEADLAQHALEEALDLANYLQALLQKFAISAVCRACEVKQAEIDRLMLEYCSKDMSPEQIAEWARHQRPAQPQEAQPIPNEQFAIVKDRRYDGEGQLSLAVHDGVNYQFSDGDCYDRDGDTLDGYTAEFLTQYQLEQRLNAARQSSNQPKVSDELERLRAEVKEWLCESCNTVYPGPPQKGFHCVICPKCGGHTGTRLEMENRSLKQKLADHKVSDEAIAKLKRYAVTTSYGWRDIRCEPWGEYVKLDDVKSLLSAQSAAAPTPDSARLWSWLKPRFTGYDFFWMGSPDAETEEGKGKVVAVFEVGQGFIGGKDIEAAIAAHMEAKASNDE